MRSKRTVRTVKVFKSLSWYYFCMTWLQLIAPDESVYWCLSVCLHCTVIAKHLGRSLRVHASAHVL